MQFILYWLFHNDYEHILRGDKPRTRTFTSLISDKGQFYEFNVFFEVEGKKICKVTFLDSLKLIPLSVSAIAKSFHLKEQKLEIDYDAHNKLPIGSPLSKDEVEYIKNDVIIVAHAINYFKSEGLDKMTIGACALSEYKKIITQNSFKRYYPTPTYHEDVRQSYRGGFTYLNPKFKEKIVGNGIVLDVNSLYPSVMYDNYLPFGTPIYFEGEYKDDPIYPLYTQMIRCSFEIKEGKIPTIQIKHGYGFIANEYLESSNGEEVVLCLNSVDMKLFKEHYNIYNLEYMSGWKFKSTKGLFQEYIDKWSTNKINAKKEGNHGLYLVSKLFLNSLYGKFGTDTKCKSKIPYLADDDVVRYHTSEWEEKDGIYIAVASFITSYARLKTITSAQKIMDDYNSGKSKIQFVYADTDSLHCVSEDFSLPEGLDIDDVKLGAWKFETKFNKAKFLRQKCYIENSTEDVFNDNPEYELKVTIAGMPKKCHNLVNFDNFKIGATYSGKLVPKNTIGGVVLVDTDFTIKE